MGKGALCDAIPTAVGCADTFAVMAVEEAKRVLDAKNLEVTTTLGQWDQRADQCSADKRSTGRIGAGQSVSLPVLVASSFSALTPTSGACRFYTIRRSFFSASPLEGG